MTSLARRAMEAQAEAIVKKNGFANLDEYDDVSFNISMILPGIDPQTKKFTEPPEQIKKEIAALKADKSVPEAEKREGLAQLEAALKNAKPIQFKENIALVLKHFDKLAPLMQEQDSDLRIRTSPIIDAAGPSLTHSRLHCIKLWCPHIHRTWAILLMNQHVLQRQL
jgi:hypothetical protein